MVKKFYSGKFFEKLIAMFQKAGGCYDKGFEVECQRSIYWLLNAILNL